MLSLKKLKDTHFNAKHYSTSGLVQFSSRTELFPLLSCDHSPISKMRGNFLVVIKQKDAERWGFEWAGSPQHKSLQNEVPVPQPNFFTNHTTEPIQPPTGHLT